MTFYSSIAKTPHLNANKGLCNEDCYCQPFNNPLDINGAFTTSDLETVFCSGVTDNYNITSIEMVDANGVVLDTPYYVSEPIMVDGEEVVFFQMVNLKGKECFFLEITVSGSMGSVLTMYSNAYCQVGESCLRTILYPDEINGVPVTLRHLKNTDNCLVELMGCKGVLSAKFPGGTVLYVDTNIYGQITDVILSGIEYDVTSGFGNSITCYKSSTCYDYWFRIYGIGKTTKQCYGQRQIVGAYQGLNSSNVYNICIGTSFVVRGTTHVMPMAYMPLFAGDTDFIIGNSSSEDIHLASLNEANIATYALNEIGLLLASKEVYIYDKFNYDIDINTAYMMGKDTKSIYTKPVPSWNNKYLDAVLVTKKCEVFSKC